MREGGIGGSIPYKIGVTLVVKLSSGGPFPPEWRKKTVLQEPFGDYGQILRIDCQEAQGVAFIEFEDKRDAEDAEHEMNGKQIMGKPISVTLARAPDQRRGFGLGRTVDIEERIAELARRHRLDEAATARLASVFHDRSRLGCDLNRDFEELNEHLAASNKPSALVSMKLADLRAGRSIGPCKYVGVGGGSRRGSGMCEGRDDVYGDRRSASNEGRCRRREDRSREAAKPRREAAGRSRSGRASPPKTAARGSKSRSRARQKKAAAGKKKRAASSSESSRKERKGKKAVKRRKASASRSSGSTAAVATQKRRPRSKSSAKRKAKTKAVRQKAKSPSASRLRHWKSGSSSSDSG